MTKLLLENVLLFIKAYGVICFLHLFSRATMSVPCGHEPEPFVAEIARVGFLASVSSHMGTKLKIEIILV